MYVGESMVIGILQPGYLPWLGFFEQVYQSDVFVLYDDVQYDKNGWRNRNRIKTANGIQWLTVPVHVDFSERSLVCTVTIDNRTPWRKKHSSSIRINYGKAPFFGHYWPLFEEAYDRQWEMLADLDIYFIEKLLSCLGLSGRQIVRSSTLGIEGDRHNRLLNICRHFDAKVFYEGASGRNYLDEQRFLSEGIALRYQEYQHPVYRQLYGEFIPYLSIVDLLFNHGDESLAILTHNFKKRELRAHG